MKTTINTISKTFLDHMRSVKSKANKVVELVAPGHEMAEASLAILWEHLFSFLCRDEAKEELKEPSALNTVAGIFQKLMASFSQMRTLEAKIQKDTLEASKGLSSEVLEQIESRLNIL